MSKTITPPDLNEGERLAFTLLKPDGTGYHLIERAEIFTGTWQEAMDWTKAQGCDLRTRAELALRFEDNAINPDEGWHWSNTQHSGLSLCAWYQVFTNGHQHYSRKDGQLSARAVRRSVI